MKYMAVAIVAALGLAWLVGDATSDSVYVLGRHLELGCGMKLIFGVPCPGCGMTRSVLLTLHGNLREALAVNPVGPVFLGGVAIFVGACMTDKAWRVVALYAGATAALLLVNWVVVIAR